MAAKSTQLRDKNRKLTDFFSQKHTLPATSSSHTATTAANAPTTRRRPATRASTATADREYAMASSAPPKPETRSASATVTRKRTRSPDSNDPSISLVQLHKSRSPRQPAKTLKSDTPSECLRPVVYVNSPFPSRKSSSRRKTPVHARKRSLVFSPSNSSRQVVCSSKSDEEELVLPVPEPRDFGKVVEGIHTWRRRTSEFSPPSSPCAHEDAMAVDTPPSSPARGSPVTSARAHSPHFDEPVRFAATPESNAAPRTPIIVPACLPSPPDSNELQPLPPTPKPMDPEAKTAKLIAEIKARAYAAHQSSDDERPLEFRELDDSDDGDLVDNLPLISNAKEPKLLFSALRAPHDVFSPPLSSVPSTFNDIGPRTRRSPNRDPSPTRPTRVSARIRRPASGLRLSATLAGSSKSVGELKSFPPNRKKSLTTNPLHALLREKELEEKRGTSSTALRLAEEAIKESSREAFIFEDGLDAESNLRLTDEQAAWRAVREYRKSASPTPDGEMEIFVNWDRECKMLGADAEEVSKILAGNKDSKGKEKAENGNKKQTWSVPLWIRSSGEDMEVDRVSTPSLSGHPILAYMDGLRESGDDSPLDLILRTGTLATVPTSILSSNIPQLLDMALRSSSQIADAISIAFRHLWGLNPLKFQMPFAAILSVLVQLGASPTILAEYGFNSECARRNHVTAENLLNALKKFLVIVKAAGFAGALPSEDIASIVLILVIIGLDRLTSSELHTQLNITLDVVCNHVATDSLLRDIHDTAIKFARKLAPVNKARLVSFFSSGSGRTRWIAQRLAYSLLVSLPNNTSDQTLPLDPLILLLSPDAGSGELFDVSDESTNYEELRHHVDILSVALNDITPYVEEERIHMISSNNTSIHGSPSKQKKPVPPLELLRKVLDTLQGRIVDTRAAHLDRSRTKATIQRLTMRIHYDRMALIAARPRQRTSTLKAYFSPQRRKG